MARSKNIIMPKRKKKTPVCHCGLDSMRILTPLLSLTRSQAYLQRRIPLRTLDKVVSMLSCAKVGFLNVSIL